LVQLIIGKLLTVSVISTHSLGIPYLWYSTMPTTWVP
jgi:hypothetical protein